MNGRAGEGCPVGSEKSREAERLAALVEEAWRAVPTTQRMGDGTSWKTYGVLASSGVWIGRAHPLGTGEADLAAARRHALLFAAAPGMAEVLRAALAAFATQFEREEEVPGADLVQFFAAWRELARDALCRAGAL